MYKKHKPKKMNKMGFVEPKLFKVANIVRIYERCLKTRMNETIRKKASIHVEMMGMPAIKNI
ncbi:MAG: hypothetical protein JRC91_00535 [Deltaproteobacteria bacterium]|nr:hypothetical protein [Deltaproteobacteria bacterium]